MKKRIYPFLMTFTLLSCFRVFAQEVDTLSEPRWNHDIEGWFYFTPDDFIFSPIYGVDKGWLHLEGRYNYEDINTFSAFFGYNFEGGKKFQYTITPMLGGLVGSINGISPGLELNFDYFGFNFNVASEYVFDLEGKENDFFYNWTDFTFAPLEWFWFGTSFQRTQLFQAETENQFGLILGASFRWIEIEPYFYNPWTDNPYFILAISFNLPEN